MVSLASASGLLLFPFYLFLWVCVYRCFLSFAPQKEEEDHQLHPTKTPPTSPTTLSQSFNLTKREQAHKPLRGGEKRAPKTSHLTQSPTVTARTQQQKQQAAAVGAKQKAYSINR